MRSRLNEEKSAYCVATGADGIVAGPLQGRTLDANPTGMELVPKKKLP